MFSVCLINSFGGIALSCHYFISEREADDNCFVFMSKLAFEVFNSLIFCCGQCSCNINFHWVQFQKRKLYFPGSYQGRSCFKTILAAMLQLYISFCVRVMFKVSISIAKNFIFGVGANIGFVGCMENSNPVTRVLKKGIVESTLPRHSSNIWANNKLTFT